MGDFEEYTGLKAVPLVPFRKYIRERLRTWFASFKFAKLPDEYLEVRPLPVAAGNFVQLDEDNTEYDYDSDYEMELRVPEAVTNSKEVVRPELVELPFDGTGAEPNAIRLMPRAVWDEFLPKPRPDV